MAGIANRPGHAHVLDTTGWDQGRVSKALIRNQRKQLKKMRRPFPRVPARSTAESDGLEEKGCGRGGSVRGGGARTHRLEAERPQPRGSTGADGAASARAGLPWRPRWREGGAGPARSPGCRSRSRLDRRERREAILVGVEEGGG